MGPLVSSETWGLRAFLGKTSKQNINILSDEYTVRWGLTSESGAPKQLKPQRKGLLGQRPLLPENPGKKRRSFLDGVEAGPFQVSERPHLLLLHTSIDAPHRQ